jgi:hypothetical protein
VRFIGKDGREQTIPAVNKSKDCTKTSGGWFYDDREDPNEIRVCPQTCDVLRLQLQATIEIAFGCERELAPELL